MAERLLTSDSAEALKEILAELQQLKEEDRSRVLLAACVFFGVRS